MRSFKSIPTAIIGRSSILSNGVALILNNAGYKVNIEGNYIEIDKILATSRHPAQLFIVLKEEISLEYSERLIEKLRNAKPSSFIVVLSNEDVSGDIGSLSTTGANGWLPLSIGPKGLVAALDLITAEQVQVAVVRSGRMEIPTSENQAFGPSLRDKLGIRILENCEDRTVDIRYSSGRDNLSDREKAVLQGLIKGEANKVIARRLSISEATVKIHVRSLLRKIGAENRTQAAIWVLNENLYSTALQSNSMNN